MDSLSGEQPLEPVEPAYQKVLGARLLLFWLVLTIAAIVFDRLVLSGTPLAWLLAVLVPVVGASTVLTAPSRIYARLGFRLTGRILQVVRGWLFHTDTVVPLVRVQHIDVTRGPLDKMFGTASLIVHTAGTHNSIVALPGLSPSRAAEIRDAIREHVRTDFV